MHNPLQSTKRTMMSFRTAVVVVGVLVLATALAVRIENNPCECKQCQKGGKCSVVVLDDSLHFTCTCRRKRAGRRCTFRRPCYWLNNNCTSNIDCEIPIGHEPSISENTDAQPICFKGECLCSPGYFYSISQRFCVKYCPSSDLQNSFTRYPGSRVTDHKGYVVLPEATVDSCKQDCENSEECENFDISGNICYSARASSGPSVPIDQDAPMCDYYQRDCA